MGLVYYIFRRIPDLIFTTTKVTGANAHISDDDKFEFVEVKHGGH